MGRLQSAFIRVDPQQKASSSMLTKMSGDIYRNSEL